MKKFIMMKGIQMFVLFHREKEREGEINNKTSHQDPVQVNVCF